MSLRQGRRWSVWLGAFATTLTGLAAAAEPPEPTATTPAPPSAPAADWETRPDTLEYDPNRPVVPGYAVERYHPRGYFIAGSITFGVGYGLGVLAVAADTEKDFDAGWLLLPIAGPFIGMATQRETCEMGVTPPTNCGRATSTIVVLAALGTMQVVGAGLFTLGLTQSRLRQVRADRPQLTLAPIPLGRRGCGLGAAGTF
jgi:hypothetical protein